MSFQKATRGASKLKLALTGTSGSGKTYSALLIAKGLAPGGRIAVIDTENRSASLYADDPKKEIPAFDTIDLEPPFHTDKYLKWMGVAVQEGYDVLIIDSITHQWSAEGGIMDRKDKEQLAKPQQNSYTLWAKYTPEHERFKQAIVQADIHIIATIRSKQDYVVEQNDKGKAAPRKVGMAPIQRDQFEYEFTTVLDLNQEHVATTSKDRTGLFDGKHFKPSEETGKELAKWLRSGVGDQRSPRAADPVSTTPIAAPAPAGIPQDHQRADPQKLGEADAALLKGIYTARGWNPDDVRKYMMLRWGTEKLGALQRSDFQDLIGVIQAAPYPVAVKNWDSAKAAGAAWNPDAASGPLK